LEVKFVINIEYVVDECFSKLHFGLRLFGVNRIIYNSEKDPAECIVELNLAGVLCFLWNIIVYHI